MASLRRLLSSFDLDLCEPGTNIQGDTGVQFFADSAATIEADCPVHAHPNVAAGGNTTLPSHMQSTHEAGDGMP